MNELLKPKQVVSSSSGQTCEVISILGSGGQGEVYKVKWGDGEYALKWYFLESATDQQRRGLDALIALGPPSNRFLWPLDIVEAKGVKGFGYVMRLRPGHFKGLTALVDGRIKPKRLALITLGIELTKALRTLHNKGLCYQDISFGNAFFDPSNGDVLICDNDNVATDRAPISGVVGTPDFMAPEIVRGEANPSIITDRHSLAVLLFFIFCIGHPLCGKKMLSVRCWDLASRGKLFGTEPVFIFDPTNPINAAVDLQTDDTGEAGGTAMKHWNMLPAQFQETFVRAFTTGLHHPDARVTELEWLESLSSLRNSIFRCSCDSPNYYEFEKMKVAGAKPRACWCCGKEPQLPFRIRIEKQIVMLNADSKLFPHHMGDGRSFDFSQPLAEVVRHPTNPNLWGLKNLSPAKWVATLPDGTLRDNEPGRSVPLLSQTKINFGRVEGEIRY